MTPITLQALYRLADKALQHGGSHLGHSNAVEWDVGAYCDDPQARTLHARGDAGRMTAKYKWASNPKSLTVHLAGLPCRRCAKCLWLKSEQWTDRAMTELALWPRSWFVTLTLDPAWQHRSFMAEMADKNSRGWRDSDFDLSKAEWNLRAVGAAKLLTKYLKNVRKPHSGEAAIDLRYLCSIERHKSGLPHLHLLMHEAGGKLTYRRILDRWKYGRIKKANLVSDHDEAAWYVCKYVSLNEATRVRCSLRYGRLQTIDRLAKLEVALVDLFASPDAE